MERARYLRMYDLHSWTGAVFGLIVFAVSFTGCLALFYDELQTWEDPARRIELNSGFAPIHETYSGWIAEELGENELSFNRLDFPIHEKPYFNGYLQFNDENGKLQIREKRWHPNTGEVIPYRGEGVALWLKDFHRDLMWPDNLGGRQIGRGLVGFVGIFMLFSIITGVLAHKKIIKNMFSLRYLRSIRLKWQDTHTILGIWGLPFSTMIAFTGAFLGVVVILAPVIALLAMRGDQEALIEKVLGTPTEPAGIVAEMYPLDKVAKIKEPDSGYPAEWVNVRNWGDQNAEYDVFFKSDKELRQVDSIMISGTTGERMSGQFEKLSTPNHIINAMSPLHYGTYGGIWLKILYLVLGLLMSVMTAMGMMLWIERRKYGGQGEDNPKKYTRFSHLFTGVMVGLPVASAALFYHEVFYFGKEEFRIVSTGQTYFIVWALAVIYAFIRNQDYKATKELLMLTGVMFAGVPLLDLYASNRFFLPSLFEVSNAAAFANLAILITGFVSIMTAIKIPSQRFGR